MNLHDSVLALIDLRSFSNLWFWLALAATWSRMTNSSLGVPLDMIQRAKRRGGEAMADMETLCDIETRRRRDMFERAGVIVLLVWSMICSLLLVLGFRYRIELAQAFSLLLVPLTFVGLLQMWLVQRLTTTPLTGIALVRALLRHRMGVQAVGLAAILLTTLFGMWHNLNMRVLG